METYQAPADNPPSVSTVNIPVRLKGWEIEHLINNKLNGTIYEDRNLEDDGLMFKAEKSNWITLRFDGLQLTYRVPLKIWVFKKIFGSKGLEAEGEIALNFRTTLNIQSDWSVEPITELVSYEWIRNMAVKTGIGNLDIKYLANVAIDKSKPTLTQAIDKQLKANFQIRQNLEEAWRVMQRPLSISSSYGTWWVKMTPQSVEMTPFRTVNGVIESNIAVFALAEVYAGDQQPIIRADTYLPPFKLGYANTDDFTISLSTYIGLKEAERMAKSFAVGQVFNPSGKEIRITNVELFGQNDKIVVNTSFTGSYNGSLYLVGRPVFNPQKNTIELTDLDYDIQTKNFMIKSAKWLFDRVILKKMQEACVFQLDENVKFFKTMMNDQLRSYKLNNNVTVNGSVEDIRVDNIALLQDKIKIYVSSKGKLNLDVNGLDSF